MLALLPLKDFDGNGEGDETRLSAYKLPLLLFFLPLCCWVASLGAVIILFQGRSDLARNSSEINHLVGTDGLASMLFQLRARERVCDLRCAKTERAQLNPPRGERYMFAGIQGFRTKQQRRAWFKDEVPASWPPQK